MASNNQVKKEKAFPVSLNMVDIGVSMTSEVRRSLQISSDEL